VKNEYYYSDGLPATQKEFSRDNNVGFRVLLSSDYQNFLSLLGMVINI